MDAKDIQKCINEQLDCGDKNPLTLEELNAYLSDYVESNNNSPQNEFEGYSSVEMKQLLNYTFEDSSPLKLHKLSDEDYAKIPILCQIKHLIQILQNEGKVKLTAIGNLPTRIVKELYPLGVRDHFIESGISKLSKESDSQAVGLTRILLQLMRVTKVRHNVLTMTKEGEKIAANNELLMANLMDTFCLQFNKAYFDGYESEVIGNMGVGFTLLLLKKYGAEKRSDFFYAEKYFRVFPLFLDGLRLYEASSCYSIRTFDRLLMHLGLIEIVGGKGYGFIDKYIIKTELYDKLITIEPLHNK